MPLERGIGVSGTIRLQERIAGLLECGTPLAEVQRGVIEASDLDRVHKSALSRYAIALSDGRDPSRADDKLRVVPAGLLRRSLTVIGVRKRSQSTA
jgi:hypothetical protein